MISVGLAPDKCQMLARLLERARSAVHADSMDWSTMTACMRAWDIIFMNNMCHICANKEDTEPADLSDIVPESTFPEPQDVCGKCGHVMRRIECSKHGKRYHCRYCGVVTDIER